MVARRLLDKWRELTSCEQGKGRKSQGKRVGGYALREGRNVGGNGEEHRVGKGSALGRGKRAKT